MNLKNFLLAMALVTALSFPSKTFAQSYGGYGSYNPTFAPGIVHVNKQVRNPVTGVYVDNLGLNDPHFFADNAIFFRISVENSGTSTISRVTVTDNLPPFIQYVSGGNYSAGNRQVQFYFDNVAPGERRYTTVQVRALPLDQLPAAKSLLCPVNRVFATSVDGGNAEDSAQFCIEKSIMVAKVPQTGDPIGLLMGLGSLPMLFAGYKLGKKRQ